MKTFVPFFVLVLLALVVSCADQPKATNELSSISLSSSRTKSVEPTLVANIEYVDADTLEGSNPAMGVYAIRSLI